MTERSTGRLLLILAIMGIGWLVGSGEAHAHAYLTGSIPGDGDELDVAPVAVVLEFNEAVTPIPSEIAVRDIRGERVDLGVRVDGNVISIELGRLGRGSYAVEWGVTSRDGHPVRGELHFSVGEPLNPAITAVTPAEASWPGPVATIARALGYLSAALAIGFAMFALVISSDPGRRWRRAAGWAAFATAVAAGLVVAAETLRLVGGDWGALARGTTWELAWDARHLPGGLLVAAGSLAVIAWAMERPRRVGRSVCAVGLSFVALGLAWSGHPAASDPGWLGVVVNTVHVLAVGSWFGGLVALGASVSREDESEPRDVARRFSSMATVAFPVAVLSGLALLWQVLPGWQELVETSYGRLILAKVSVVALAGVLAFVNRRRVLSDAVEHQGLPMQRLIGVELLALVVAIGFAASIAGTSPGQAGAAQEAASGTAFETDTFAGPYHVVINVDPARRGLNTVTVDFHAVTEEGETQPGSVSAAFTTAGQDPATTELVHAEGARWRGAVELPEAGQWMLRLSIESAETELSIQLRVEIRP